ncbi:Glycoside hydrolase family 2 catalytic domain [Trinorchestia longiramus]|nr:Glycoside hydrolase family 2 catalytic domain [Trinorchestia longiramus]
MRAVYDELALPVMSSIGCGTFIINKGEKNLLDDSNDHSIASKLLNEKRNLNEVSALEDAFSNSKYPSHEKDLPPAQYDWGGLYPRASPSREVKSLDGVWNFRLSPKDDPDKGFRESWFSAPLSTTGEVIAMAVPSSYNEATQDKNIREHIGWAWYDSDFYVPSRWAKENQRVVLRFGSITYNSIVYLNGKTITSHVGGHLPVMADVTSALNYSSKNLITVAVNNTLTPETLPQGSIIYHDDLSKYPPGYFEQTYNFDFFNFAGIDRPVYLYTTPLTYIDNVLVVTHVNSSGSTASASVEYVVTSESPSGTDVANCSVTLLDANDTLVVSADGCAGVLSVPQPQLWWPYLMDPVAGYQYTLWVQVYSSAGEVDVYPVKVGLREVAWNTTGVTINGRPLYIRGCGKHEDADIRGKGYDAALVVKDFSLLKWLGANAFRTSHYPYAEEIMDRADAEGIMVIDESPAIGLSGFQASLQARHIAVMKEFILRDRNRPGVVMWSVGNEPKSSQAMAADYFKAVVNASKIDDPTRPVTAVLSESVTADLAAQALDVIWVNRYYSWYTDTGHLEIIQRQTISEFENWHLLYGRPVGISEYGAGSIPGLHMGPSFTWSEEYQTELLLNNFVAFDDLRNRGYFMGEMIWNFADFLTPQEYKRPAMCMKGLFTRARQPKMAAHVTRARYLDLAEWDNSSERLQRYHRATNSTLNPELRDDIQTLDDDLNSEEQNGIYAIERAVNHAGVGKTELLAEDDHDDDHDSMAGVAGGKKVLEQSTSNDLCPRRSDSGVSGETRVQAFTRVFGMGEK